MSPDELRVGQRYPGDLLDEDGALFEFSKEGPELRLFFSGIPEEAVREVESGDCYLGLLRAEDVAVIPWKIGDHMMGDAQFHVFLYLPETRPTNTVMEGGDRLRLPIILIDRDSGEVRAIRHVMLSERFSQALGQTIAYQLGNHIGREAYDAQVSIYQNKYPDVADAIRAAQIFEKAEG